MTKKFFVQVFITLGDFFSQIILNVSKRPPFIFFYFAKEWMFQNSQRAPYHIFRHYATYRRPKKSKKNHFFPFFPHAGTVEENT